MRTSNAPSTLLCALLVGACYSPNDDPAASAGSDAESSSSGNPSTTTMTGTTVAETTLSTTTADDAESTGTESSGDATSSSADGSSGPPPDPFCGDGNVDPNEECDDGEANALTAACRPDCTPASCGDGDLWAGVEACDDGEGDNVLEVGACAPDCSRVIEEKVIELGSEISDGDFGNNPVAFADSACGPGSLAMFAYPNVREAALDPFDSSRAVDWVLRPYTAYTREDGTLLWITDDTPLLGVREGAQEDLLAGVVPGCPLCINLSAITGLDDGWTTAVANSCSLWSSGSPGIEPDLGDPYSVDEFIVDGNPGFHGDCESLSFVYVYCVEQ